MTGQLTIKWVSRDINNFLNNKLDTTNIDYCLYNDTDSGYFNLNQWVNKFCLGLETQKIVDKIDEFCVKELQVEINKSFKALQDYLNHRVLILDMTRENIFSSTFFTAKKRYAMAVWDSEGTRYKEPDIKIQGLEAVKNSYPRIVRSLIKDAIITILLKTEEELQEFIAQARDDFRTKPFVEVAITRGCNNILKYSSSTSIFTKGCPIGVRGVLVYNHLLKKHNLQDKYQPILEGEKVKLCYLKMPNPSGSNVIAAPDELPPEFGLDEFLDFDTQFDKTFIEPVKSMCQAVQWQIENIPDLEDLFTY